MEGGKALVVTIFDREARINLVKHGRTCTKDTVVLGQAKGVLPLGVILLD